MNRDDGRGQVVIASGINALAGLWLIIAPFLLDYSDDSDALWNDIIIGGLILLFAAIRALGAFEAAWLSWVNVALGGWLIIAPFILDNTDDSANMWNDIIVGAIVVVVGIWSALASPDTART